MRADESRPGDASEAAPKVFGGTDASVPRPGDNPRTLDAVIDGQPAVVVLDVAPVHDLTQTSAREWSVWLDGYAAGLDHAHRSEEEREKRVRQETFRLSAHFVRACADIPTHDELEEQRHRNALEAAARHRAAAEQHRPEAGWAS